MRAKGAVTLYCDESGGWGAGAMALAAAMMAPSVATSIVARFRTATGLRGEIKGSRISFTERAYLLDMFGHAGGRAFVAVAARSMLERQAPRGQTRDLALYAALLDHAVGRGIAEAGERVTHVVIDDGRYDPAILDMVRSSVQARLSGWGRASLADSARSDGIQIADVIANSLFNSQSGTQRARRIGAILEPLLASGTIEVIELAKIE